MLSRLPQINWDSPNARSNKQDKPVNGSQVKGGRMEDACDEDSTATPPPFWQTEDWIEVTLNMLLIGVCGAVLLTRCGCRRYTDCEFLIMKQMLCVL